MKNNNTQGGARPGAGRKATGRETVTISVRIEKQLLTDLKAVHGKKLPGMIADLIRTLLPSPPGSL